MLFAEWVTAIQTAGASQSGDSTAAAYFAMGLVAALLGLVVLTFIRSNARRSPKRGETQRLPRGTSI